MFPRSIGSSRFIQRRSVDLPEPEGPMITTVSFGATLIAHDFNTWRGPNLLSTPMISRSGSGCVCMVPSSAHRELAGRAEKPVCQRHRARLLALLRIEPALE